MAYVYRHIRLDKNEVFYIGIGGLTKEDYYSRAYQKNKRNSQWNNVVNSTDYIVEIISDEWLTPDEAKNKEIFWISYHGRKDLKNGTLVNLTDGGDGNTNLSQESRKKISISSSGDKNPNKRPDIKEKQRLSHIGKKESGITKYRKSLAQKIAQNTPEMKKLKSLIFSGEKNCMKRLEFKVLASKRMTDNNHMSKPIMNIETKKIYKSISEAAREFKVHRRKIREMINSGLIIELNT